MEAIGKNINQKGMFLFILNNWIYSFYAVIETIGSVVIVLCLSLSNVYDKITTNYLPSFPGRAWERGKNEITGYFYF